jgi:GTPase SAR1 family protein
MSVGVPLQQEQRFNLHCAMRSGLLACMEYLEENLDEWLGEELESFGDDDYIVFDCPGQIELYSNSNVFRAFTQFLQSNGWHVRLSRFHAACTCMVDAEV